VGELPLGVSLSTPFDRLCLLANRLALPVNIAALVLICLLAAAGFYYQQQQVKLGETVQQLQAHLGQTLAAQPPPPSLHNYEAPLAFAKILDQNQRTPGFGRILGDLSLAMGRGMQLVDVDASYDGDQLTVAVTGRIESPFKDAHGSYQRFLNLLQSRHYTIKLDQFDTQIRHSQFRVQLVRAL
jgi:hypothetical protein